MRWLFAVACAGCSFQHGALSGSNVGDDDAGARDGANSDDGSSSTSSWWNTAWPYRMRLTIADPAPLPMGFQVGFARDVDAAPCTANRDNVRIVRGNAELARVIDEVGTNEWIWFRLQAALPANTPATDYWMYCGNASPDAAPSDPTQVFDLYQPFDGNSLPSGWASTGTVSIGGGVVTLQNGGGVRTTATFPPNSAADFSMAPQTTATTMYFWGGFQNGTAFTAPWVLWNARTRTEIAPEESDSSGTQIGQMPHALDTAMHLYGVENYGNASLYRDTDAPHERLVHLANISQAISVRFHNYSSTDTIQIDMARVRKAVDPPPTVTVGMAEMAP